jgi:hypothetical protein
MRQATDLKHVPLSLLPGMTLNTTGEDSAPIKQLRLMRFSGTSMERRQLRVRVPYDGGGKGLHCHGGPEEVSGPGSPPVWYELIHDVRFWREAVVERATIDIC